MPRQRRKYALRRKVAKTAKKRLRKGLAAARYKQSARRENRASARKNAPERAFGRRAAKVGPFPGKRGRAETKKRGGGKQAGRLSGTFPENGAPENSARPEKARKDARKDAKKK